jgi:hypothetical protein
MLHPLRTIVTVLAGIVVLANTAAFAQPAETPQIQLEPRFRWATCAAGSTTWPLI